MAEKPIHVQTRDFGSVSATASGLQVQAPFSAMHEMKCEECERGHQHNA